VNEKKHLLSRLPLVFGIIIFLAFSPAIIGLGGAWLHEFFTGQTCHEGNCMWMVLPWLSLFTLPLGGLIAIILSIVDVVLLLKNN